ncbi:hypothetical protein JOQ06_014978 [Pogonophryne albipinna]|uniref:SHSP domain-containing protein n=1 Tax=Pogonophryne albipinna TaxID=1090488 RepID=A0AAD6ALC2_9TELE|nr:hypothetical protein JOQ06_014978 [Pogonophryne albipinna]
MEALSRPIETTTGHSYPTGKIQVMGFIFQFTLDVSGFSPEDVVITTSNNRIKVEAEKVSHTVGLAIKDLFICEDGAVTHTFCHRCKLPSSVDPISVTMSMEIGAAGP